MLRSDAEPMKRSEADEGCQADSNVWLRRACFVHHASVAARVKLREDRALVQIESDGMQPAPGRGWLDLVGEGVALHSNL